MAMTLSDEIAGLLQERGADLVGFADLRVLPAPSRHNLPHAVAFAVALSPEIVAGIKDGPTKEYHAEYERVNALLGELSRATADLIKSRGFEAISSPATDANIDTDVYSTELPHKTVCTLAGFGWIGRCALLVSKQFGSAIRLNRVLTDAPLPAGTPEIESRCGDCRACVDVCPGLAPTGDHWRQGKHRDEFFDASACRTAARQKAQKRTGILGAFCGICIAACPWTQSYIKRSSRQSHVVDSQWRRR
jgi:epoxyqueuosine reductase QueG